MLYKISNFIFSENINYLLKKQYKKQIDLSKALNIPKSTVSSWCCGKRVPRLDTLDKIAMYFNIEDPSLLLSPNLKNFL